MKVLISYSTREINADSAFSVSRLLYFLYEELSRQGVEVSCFSWDHQGTKEPNISYLRMSITGRFVNKYINKKFRKNYFNSKVRQLSSDKNFDFVICATADSVNFFLKYYPAEKIVYWAHNYPEMSGITDFVKIVSKHKICLVTPSLALYKRMWHQFCPETLAVYYKHIPNFALPPVAQTKVSDVSRIDIDTSGAINIIHVSGQQTNKGLHLIKKVMGGLYPEIKVNFIFIGSKKEVSSKGNLTIIEMPRMSYSELTDLYKMADFGIMSSIWFETAPLALHEMLENEVIPIVTQSGGMEEILTGARYLSIEHPNEIDEWKIVLEKCLSMGRVEIEEMKKHNLRNYSAGKLNMQTWGNAWVSLFNTMKS